MFTFKHLPEECPNRNMGHVPVFNKVDDWICRLCGTHGYQPKIGTATFKQYGYADLKEASDLRDSDMGRVKGQPVNPPAIKKPGLRITR